MTRDPDCVTASSNATEALNRMVSGGFRHLPILDDSGDIIGLLDITECLLHALARLEKADATTKQLFAVLDDVSDKDALNKIDFSTMAAAIKEHLCFPRLSSVMDSSKVLPEVSIKASVREAARTMKDNHQTAVLVVDDSKPVGIFTTKDIVTRIYGQNFEPSNTSTIRVMTPNPDMVSTDTTILQALRQMQDERYQHLPLINSKKIVVGMVDILQLTYSTLNTLKSLNGEQVEDGVVWNKFWNSMSPEEPRFEEPKSDGSTSESPQNESLMVTGLVENPIIRRRAPSTSITTPPSTENTIPSSPSRRNSRVSKLEEGAFIYKCKYERSKESHRFTSSTQNFSELCDQVRSKMKIGKDSEIVVSYVDDENDKIMLSSDDDLSNAMELARSQNSPMVRLFVEVKSDEGSYDIKQPEKNDGIEFLSYPPSPRQSSQKLPNSDAAKAATIGGFLTIGVAIGVGVMWAAKSR
ncbi:1017_t:CDS:2 [Acaulospora colombiana]|uniref:1017_t:CDS:1 n=1 Tax=Acaulospora colombiana TaxID=27376 RepID=A0ACA9K8D5_9GLOM|nr:1017_t:CDS:2 [Acaulospora colombiana]